MSARAKKPTTKPPPRAKRGTVKGHESGTIPIQKPPDAPDDQKTSIYDSAERRKKNLDHSGPIEVISMKTPGVGSGPAPIERPRPQVKLRAISEVTPLEHAQPANLGRIAPPRDPRKVRARRFRDYIVWASLAVMLASAVALGIWFLAR